MSGRSVIDLIYLILFASWPARPRPPAGNLSPALCSEIGTNLILILQTNKLFVVDGVDIYD